MIRPPVFALLLLALLALLSGSGASLRAVRVNGRVVDAVTRTPIADAILTTGDKELRSDPHGLFFLDVADTDVVRVRAQGYVRADVPVQALRKPEAEVRLKPFSARCRGAVSRYREGRRVSSEDS